MSGRSEYRDSYRDPEPDFESDGGGGTATITFEAESVTGGRSVTATFQRDLEAGPAAHAIASELGLPDDVAWTLLSSRGAFLDERQPVGKQVRPGERVTVTPKAHLGA